MRTNPWGTYRIEVSVGEAEFVSRSIGDEGHGCEVFVEHEDADRTCRIAINLIPTIIGGEAYGELNSRRTPALDALVWRARANGDPSICERGGLGGGFLVECHTAAQDASYEYVAGDIHVRVPIGGGLPIPTF